MAKPRRGRGWSGFLLGVIVVVALLWIGYWFAAHRMAEAAIDRATSTPVGGHEIGCEAPILGGFPLRLELSCARASFGGAGEAVTAVLGGGLSAAAPLYRPGYVEATLTGPLAVNVPRAGAALTAEWSSAIADVSAWIDGLTGASARFADLVVESDGDAPAIPVKRLEARTAEAAVAPAAGGGYRLTGATTGLDVTRTNGSALPEIDGEANIVGEDLGTSLGTDPAAKLRDWLRAGGTVRIDRLQVAMAGAEIVAEGSLALSPEGLLNGSILLSYNSIEALGGLIETLKPGSRDSLDLALQGLNAVSKPVTIDGRPFRQTPLTFTDGAPWLAIFPLPVDPIPPIRF